MQQAETTAGKKNKATMVGTRFCEMAANLSMGEVNECRKFFNRSCIAGIMDRSAQQWAGMFAMFEESLSTLRTKVINLIHTSQKKQIRI